MFDTHFRAGLKGGAIVALSAAPFGALFGAVAVDNGLSILEAILMSATIYAGASQLVGIELFGQNLEPWLIVLSIFAVNFRHILYSAAMVRSVEYWPVLNRIIAFFFLVDPQFAETVRRQENGEAVRFSWYLGFALAIYFPWIGTTGIGAFFGEMIGDPKALGFDVLLPIYFMGMVIGFRKRDNFYSVMVASALVSIAAYHYVGSPWHVSIGAAAGILVAVLSPPPASPSPLVDDSNGVSGQ